MESTPYFLALEPDEQTAERILGYKRRVRELVGEQLYLGDPPHMTLYLALFASELQVVDAARACAERLATPQLSLDGWHAFQGDPLTGLNTLVLDFTEGNRQRLRRLQSEVVTSVCGSRDESATLAKFADRLEHLNVDQCDAVRQFGFPYLGDGWHPHFTVASIQPAAWPTVERALLSDPPLGPANCPRLTVYRLDGLEPKQVASFELGQASEPAPLESTDLAALDTLKEELAAALWEVVDQHDWILSATITGSFLTSQSLDAFSDVDVVVVASHLNGPRFELVQADCHEALAPILARNSLGLRMNPTLGPRKLNDADTAVLHLMLYSREGHRQHVISSPFTCLDWQRSATFRKASLADVYPAFGLQPHHFVSARRGVQDYLRDFEQGVVSYRELDCTEIACKEVRREEPMTVRGQGEFAYHMLRFLMQNLLKLVRRRNEAPDGEALLGEFFGVFPRGADPHCGLYLELQTYKRERDFRSPIEHLSARLRAFLADFETQFRSEFIDGATRHVLFRHAATPLNGGVGATRQFVGRLDPSIERISAEDVRELASAVESVTPTSAFVSPARRCLQSIELLRGELPLPAPASDWRLAEINYGACDGLTVEQARRGYPSLFADWEAGEDPRFPNGENTADVLARVTKFANETWPAAAGNSVCCTHNVVLRCLVGEALGVPRRLWSRIQPPHLAPITIVQTRRFGRFIDLEESVERRLFNDFLIADVERQRLPKEAA